MSDVLPDDAEVASTLDDLIDRLSKGKRTPDVRNALIEAKRLKSATTKWGVIPPPPDARRELLERVTVLLALAPEVDDRPPESSRRAGAKAADAAKKGRSPHDERTVPSKRLVDLHDEQTRPEGRFRSIHDEETAPMPSTTRAPSQHPLPSTVKAHALDGGPPRSVHDEDTAPGPEARAAKALAEEPVVRELPRRASVTIPPVTQPSPTQADASGDKALQKPSDEPPPPKPSDEPPPPKPSDKPPAKLSDKPPAKLSDKPPAKLSDKPPAKLSDKPPAKLSDKPPAKPAAGPPSRRVERAQSAPLLFASLDDLDLSDLELFSAPTSKSAAGLEQAPQLPPIVMPKLEAPDDRPKIDGFSSAVSSPKLAAVRGPQSKRTAPLPAVMEGAGVTVVRGGSAWQPHPQAAHVMLRTLHGSGAHTTTLVRLPPNAQLPARKVTTESAIVVILGSAAMGPYELSAGDSCRVEKDAMRHAITTSGACTLLFVGAESDV